MDSVKSVLSILYEIRVLYLEILARLKHGTAIDPGKVWDKNVLSGLQKMGFLITDLLTALKKSKSSHLDIANRDFLNHLSDLVGSRNSLLRSTDKEQIKEIASTGAQEWLSRFSEEIERLISALDNSAGSLQNKDPESPSRRAFLKAIGAAGAYAMLHPLNLGAIERRMILDRYDKTQITESLAFACQFVENLTETQTRKIAENVLFAPHFDYTHFNRVGDSREEYFGIVESGDESIRAIESQREFAIKCKRVVDRHVPIAERSIVSLANLAGRCRVKGKLLVIKHFPGGPAELETTEKQDFEIPYKFGAMLNTYLKPFSYGCYSGRVRAVMTSHGIYQELEKDLRRMYPGIAEFYMDNYRPATFSPLINLGLLRGYFKFRGVIVSDWLNMKPIEKNLLWLDRKLPKDNAVSRVSDADIRLRILKVILPIYAGVNWLAGFTPPPLRKKQFYSVLEEFYDTDLHFHQQIDNSAAILGKMMQEIFPSESVGMIASKMGFQEKVQLVFGQYQNTNLISRPWIDLLQKSTDVNDRGCELHEFFRRAFLTKLTGIDMLPKDLALALPVGNNDQTFYEMNKNMQQNDEWDHLGGFYEHVMQARYLGY